MGFGLTPFQTVGPYFQVMLRDTPRGADTLVRHATQGTRIQIEGVLFDGEDTPLRDGLIETWQADAGGRYRHPDDPRWADADPSFDGYGRVAVDDQGAFRLETIKPGPVPGPDGHLQAPHILVSVIARGVLTRYWTRLYFPDEPSNAQDPILALVPPDRRQTLIAIPVSEHRYRFEIVIQGPRETVFFDA